MPSTHRNILLLLALAVAFVTGCASSSTSTSHAVKDKAFSNFLVIGVAGDYDSRAHFERTVVSGLRAEGSAASAFYVVTGGNNPVNRDTVREALSSGAFDAVVLTRVVSTDADVDIRSTVTNTKVTRKDGGVLDLFRYDYEDTDDPLSLQINTKATFATEVYDVASEEMMWSFDFVSSRSDNLGKLIEDTAAAVVSRLDREDLIKQ